MQYCIPHYDACRAVANHSIYRSMKLLTSIDDIFSGDNGVMFGCLLQKCPKDTL